VSVGCADKTTSFPASVLQPQPPQKSAPTTPEPPTVARAAAEMQLVPVPRRPTGGHQATPPSTTSTLRLGTEPVTATIDQMPLNAFMNTVFGDILKLSYQLDAGLATRTDIVTLHAEPQPPARFLELVRQVLVNYGITVTERNGTAVIIPSTQLAQQIPTIIRSRASASVPTGLRPIFQFVELRHGRPATMVQLLTEAFGQRVKIVQLPANNALLLMGLPEEVRAVVDAINLFDQPATADRLSIRLTPAFWTADRLSAKLAEILRTEGYEVSNRFDAPGLIQMVPVEAINALVLFAPDQPTLDHVLNWARELDRPSQVVGTNTIFYYRVRNTKADTIAPLLDIVLPQSPGSPPVGTAAQAAPAPLATGAPATGVGSTAGIGAPSVVTPAPAQSAARAGSRILVDAERNGIIFRGSAEEYAQVRSLLESLDQPVREALIEVTVAEIQLTDNTQLGVEFLLKASGIAGANGTISTLGGLGIGSAGVNFTLLNDANQTRAVLNALATDSHITILSSPRLLAKSGGEAKITVGTEVPIITSQQTTNLTSQGNPSILQSVQYRNTGVILTVKPVIHAGNRIDLEVSQEVSQASANNTSQISSPTISKRSVATNLSLRDGATIILGGLISENRSISETGIPFLKDIPGVGALFRNQSSGNSKNELIVLITPYIVDSDEDARAVTDAFRSRFPILPR
jgi:general secretion pathway protein D